MDTRVLCRAEYWGLCWGKAQASDARGGGSLGNKYGFSLGLLQAHPGKGLSRLDGKAVV